MANRNALAAVETLGDVSPAVAAAFALGYQAGCNEVGSPAKTVVNPTAKTAKVAAAAAKAVAVDAAETDGAVGGVTDAYLLEREAVHASKTSWVKLPVLADLTKSVTHIDGLFFSELVVSGFIHMLQQKVELNTINVFPIPDGDTGNNMVFCLRVPSKNLLKEPTSDIIQASRNLAADVLLCGQGNSGTILSHFYIELAESIKKVGKASLTVAEFAAVLSEAGSTMNSAVSNPVEGTLVSVIRDCCQFKSNNFATVGELFAEWHAQALAELKDTPNKLIVDGVKILEKAGVVDSGAAGFVYTVEGMLLAVQGKLEGIDNVAHYAGKSHADASDEPKIEVKHDVVGSSKYQFCTEAVIHLKDGVTKDDVLKKFVEASATGMGDSIACVGAPSKTGGDMCKVHMHTSVPQDMFDLALTFNDGEELKKEKVEDMFEERDETHGKAKYDMKDAKFDLMCTTLYTSKRDYDQYHHIPFFITPSKTGELISSEDLCTGATDVLQIMNYLRFEPQRVFTASPGISQVKVVLLKACQKSDKPILVISLNEKLGAICRNTKLAIAELIKTYPEYAGRFTNLDTHGLAMFGAARSALRAAEAGKTRDEALKEATDVGNRSMWTGYAPASSMRAFVQSGRIPPSTGITLETIQDGAYYGMGHCYPPDDLFAEDPTHMRKVMAMMTVWGQVESSPTAAIDIENTLHENIKAKLKPGETIKDLYISVCGRVDLAQEAAARWKKALPVEGEVTCGAGGLMEVTMGVWGQSVTIQYWI